MGRKFRYTDKEVKEAILRAFTQEKTNKLGFRALYRELQKDSKIKIGGFTTLQRCLKKYVDDGFLEKDEKGQYEITEIGILDYGKTLDLNLINKTKKVLETEIVPESNRDTSISITPEGILPFNISIYLTPSIEFDIDRDRHVLASMKKFNPEFKKKVMLETTDIRKFLDDITYSVTGYYEKLLTDQIYAMDYYWGARKVQQLNKKQREHFVYDYFNWAKKFDSSSQTKDKEYLRSTKETVKEYIWHCMNETFAVERKRTPHSLTEILDIDSLCIVRLSRDHLKKKSENIRMRLVKWFISDPDLPHRATIGKHPIMQIILNPEEYSAYSKAKTNKQREKFIQKLRKKYEKTRIP